MSICNEKQVINFGSWNLVIHTKLMEGIDRLGRAEITTVWAMPVLATGLCCVLQIANFFAQNTLRKEWNFKKRSLWMLWNAQGTDLLLVVLSV